jgi:hypothetical protein
MVRKSQRFTLLYLDLEIANPKDTNDAGSKALAALNNVWDPEKVR